MIKEAIQSSESNRDTERVDYAAIVPPESKAKAKPKPKPKHEQDLIPLGLNWDIFREQFQNDRILVVVGHGSCGNRVEQTQVRQGCVFSYTRVGEKIYHTQAKNILSRLDHGVVLSKVDPVREGEELEFQLATGEYGDYALSFDDDILKKKLCRDLGYHVYDPKEHANKLIGFKHWRHYSPILEPPEGDYVFMSDIIRFKEHLKGDSEIQHVMLLACKDIISVSGKMTMTCSSSFSACDRIPLKTSSEPDVLIIFGAQLTDQDMKARCDLMTRYSNLPESTLKFEFKHASDYRDIAFLVKNSKARLIHIEGGHENPSCHKLASIIVGRLKQNQEHRCEGCFINAVLAEKDDERISQLMQDEKLPTDRPFQVACFQGGVSNERRQEFVDFLYMEYMPNMTLEEAVNTASIVMPADHQPPLFVAATKFSMYSSSGPRKKRKTHQLVNVTLEMTPKGSEMDTWNDFIENVMRRDSSFWSKHISRDSQVAWVEVVIETFPKIPKPEALTLTDVQQFEEKLRKQLGVEEVHFSGFGSIILRMHVSSFIELRTRWEKGKLEIWTPGEWGAGEVVLTDISLGTRFWAQFLILEKDYANINLYESMRQHLYEDWNIDVEVGHEDSKRQQAHPDYANINRYESMRQHLYEDWNIDVEVGHEDSKRQQAHPEAGDVRRRAHPCIAVAKLAADIKAKAWLQRSGILVTMVKMVFLAACLVIAVSKVALVRLEEKIERSEKMVQEMVGIGIQKADLDNLERAIANVAMVKQGTPWSQATLTRFMEKIEENLARVQKRNEEMLGKCIQTADLEKLEHVIANLNVVKPMPPSQATLTNDIADVSDEPKGVKDAQEAGASSEVALKEDIDELKAKIDELHALAKKDDVLSISEVVKYFLCFTFPLWLLYKGLYKYLDMKSTLKLYLFSARRSEWVRNWVPWLFGVVGALRSDDLFLVIGNFVGGLFKGGVDAANLTTIMTTLLYHFLTEKKEALQDDVLRVSYNYWEEHPSGKKDIMFMFNALSEDKGIQDALGNAFPPTRAFVLSQTTRADCPFLKLEKQWAKELFPKLGAMLSDMNSTELLKSSVLTTNLHKKKRFHTFVLGVSFETAPQGSKKFRIMVMEENQLKACLGGDDEAVYEKMGPGGDPPRVHYGIAKTEGCATPYPHQREDRLRVMRIMANLWFNSNGGEDVQLKEGDDIKSFKLTKKELEISSGSTINVLEEQLKDFFASRAQTFSDKVAVDHMDVLGLAQKPLERTGIAEQYFPSLMEKQPRSAEEEVKWKHDYFYGRLVVIDKEGQTHKLKEAAGSSDSTPIYDWLALGKWLEDSQSFKMDDDTIMARLTPVRTKKVEKKYQNRLLTNADSEWRGCRGLTSVDIYGLVD